MPRSALAVETHENWLEQHRYLNMDELREHKKEGLRHGPLLSPLGQLPVPPGQSTLRRTRRLMVRYASGRLRTGPVLEPCRWGTKWSPPTLI